MWIKPTSYFKPTLQSTNTHTSTQTQFIFLSFTHTHTHARRKDRHLPLYRKIYLAFCNTVLSRGYTYLSKARLITYVSRLGVNSQRQKAIITKVTPRSFPDWQICCGDILSGLLLPAEFRPAGRRLLWRECILELPPTSRRRLREGMISFTGLTTPAPPDFYTAQSTYSARNTSWWTWWRGPSSIRVLPARSPTWLAWGPCPRQSRSAVRSAERRRVTAGR